MREIYKGVVLKLIMNKINSQLAELTGAMMGDGCLSIIKSGKRKRKTALLTGHLQHDYEYYKEVIRPIVKKDASLLELAEIISLSVRGNFCIWPSPRITPINSANLLSLLKCG